MLTYIKGDLFNSPAQVLVNTVNTVGVMGKGIALQFKEKYPEMFKYYQNICENKEFDTGNLILWKKSEKWLLLFPTKKHWRSPSKIEYIEAGLKKFVKYYDKFGIESIAFPKLGCGNGGLDWEIIKPMMEGYLKQLPIHVYIYVDKYEESKPEHKQPTEIEKWLRDDIEAIGFSLIKEDLKKSIQNDNELLINNSELKHISWNEDNIHLINGEEIIINEKELCDLWSYIRDVGVIEIKDMPNRFEKYGEIILDIFRKLDYLQPIIVSDNGKIFSNSSNGYQYIRK